MPELVNNRQFGTGAYNLGRLPTQPTSFSLNIRTPRGPNDPTEDPSETPSTTPGSKGMGKGSSAGAKAGAVAGASAGATAGAGKAAGSKSKSLLQTLEEPFDPHSGVNQGFERQLQHAGHYIWDVTSPNSTFGHDVSNVMNFGNPIKTPGLVGIASGGSSPVNGSQFGTSSSTVKSAVGAPQEGVLGGLENAAADVGESILSAF
jgi:hypothetical protein